MAQQRRVLTTTTTGAPLLLLLLLLALGGTHAQVCTDFGPDDVTNALGVEVPQTCIDVPLDDGTGNTVMVNRCYYTYVPESCANIQVAADAADVPLVLDLHGFSGCPMLQATLSGWKELADEHCFYVVWPSGQQDDPSGPACWNVPGLLEDPDYNDVTTGSCCCDLEVGPKVDDPLFLKTILDRKIRGEDSFLDNVDPTRVYVGGHSNGCMASFAMAALYPDEVAAVLCHAGALVTPFDDTYEEALSKVPVWMVHGTADEVLRYDGGVPPGQEPWIWPLPDTAAYLAEKNNCTESMVSTDSDENLGTTYTYGGCADDATVEMVVLEGVGHMPYKVTTPGMDAMIEAMMGPVPSVDTTKLAWEFARRFSKDGLLPVEYDGEEEAGEELDPEAMATDDAEEANPGACYETNTHKCGCAVGRCSPSLCEAAGGIWTAECPSHCGACGDEGATTLMDEQEPSEEEDTTVESNGSHDGEGEEEHSHSHDGEHGGGGSDDAAAVEENASSAGSFLFYGMAVVAMAATTAVSSI